MVISQGAGEERCFPSFLCVSLLIVAETNILTYLTLTIVLKQQINSSYWKLKNDNYSIFYCIGVT